MKQDFFQAVRVSVLQYGCTTWSLMKNLEKKLDGNYTRILHAFLNKLWKQQPIKQQLYCQIHLISQTIWARWRRHAGHCWRSKDKLISDIFRLCWLTSNDLYTSTLGRHWMPSRRPTKRDGWQEQVKGLNKISMSWLYIYIYIYIYIYASPPLVCDMRTILMHSLTGLNSEFFLLDLLPYRG